MSETAASTSNDDFIAFIRATRAHERDYNAIVAHAMLGHPLPPHLQRELEAIQSSERFRCR